MSYNRLANSKNPYQGNSKKVLCVCSAGLLRSPTIAWVLSNPPYNYNTRAVGISKEYALIPVDNVLIEWADIIVCADEDHVPTIEKLLEENKTVEKDIYCLNLPDRYSTREPTLVALIKEKLEELAV